MLIPKHPWSIPIRSHIEPIENVNSWLSFSCYQLCQSKLDRFFVVLPEIHKVGPKFLLFYLCFMELFQAETLRKDLIQRTIFYWNLSKLLSQLFWLNAFELRISKNGFCFSSYFRWSSRLVVCLNFLFFATNICLKFFTASPH